MSTACQTCKDETKPGEDLCWSCLGETPPPIEEDLLWPFAVSDFREMKTFYSKQLLDRLVPALEHANHGNNLP
jgi:hypothetical protein